MNSFQNFECDVFLVSIDDDGNLIPDDIFDVTQTDYHEIRGRIKDMVNTLRAYKVRSYLIRWNDTSLTPYGMPIPESDDLIGSFEDGVIYDFEGERLGTGIRLITDGGEKENHQCILISLFN